MRYSELPLLISGFSFGSRIALRLACEQPGLACVIAAGFPTTIPGQNYVREVDIPKFFIQSEQDVFSPSADFLDLYRDVPEPKQLIWIAANDHFFRDALDAFEAAVVQLARQHFQPASLSPI